MAALAQLYAEHPFWIWLLLGVLLLAAEALTGSGWMLWPAASAVVVALVTLTGWRLGLAGELGLFAGLTLVTTVLARRYLIRAPLAHPDINDQRERLVGQPGVARGRFDDGSGRVFVNGAEWPADLASPAELTDGARVVVTAVEGSRLTVRPQ